MKHTLFVLAVWLMSSQTSFCQTNNGAAYTTENKLVAERTTGKANPHAMQAAGSQAELRKTEAGSVVKSPAVAAKVATTPSDKIVADPRALQAHTEALLANTRAVEAYAKALQENTMTVQEKAKALDAYTKALEENTNSVKQKTKAFYKYIVALEATGHKIPKGADFSAQMEAEGMASAPAAKQTRTTHTIVNKEIPLIPAAYASAKTNTASNTGVRVVYKQVKPQAAVAPATLASAKAPVKPQIVVAAKPTIKSAPAFTPANTVAKTNDQRVANVAVKQQAVSGDAHEVLLKAEDAKVTTVAKNALSQSHLASLLAKKHTAATNMIIETCNTSRLLLGTTLDKAPAVINTSKAYVKAKTEQLQKTLSEVPDMIMEKAKIGAPVASVNPPLAMLVASVPAKTSLNLLPAPQIILAKAPVSQQPVLAAATTKKAVKPQPVPVVAKAPATQEIIFATVSKRSVTTNKQTEVYTESRLVLGGSIDNRSGKNYKKHLWAQPQQPAKALVAVPTKTTVKPNVAPATMLNKTPAKPQAPLVAAAKKPLAPAPAPVALSKAPAKMQMPLVVAPAKKPLASAPAPVAFSKSPAKIQMPLAAAPAKKPSGAQQVANTQKPLSVPPAKDPVRLYASASSMPVAAPARSQMSIAAAPAHALAKLQEPLAVVATKTAINLFATTANMLAKAPPRSHKPFVVVTANATVRVLPDPAKALVKTPLRSQMIPAASVANIKPLARTAVKKSASEKGFRFVQLNDLLNLPLLKENYNGKTYSSKHTAVRFGLEEGDVVTTKGYVQVVATENAGKKDEVYYIQMSSDQKKGDPCWIIKIPSSQLAGAMSKIAADKAKKFIRERLVEGKVPCAGGNIMRHRVYVSITGTLAYNTARAAAMKGPKPAYEAKRNMHTYTAWEMGAINNIEFTTP